MRVSNKLFIKVISVIILTITGCTNQVNNIPQKIINEQSITIQDFKSFGINKQNNSISLNPFEIQSNRKPKLNKHKELVINDIKLTSTGQSIMSENVEPTAFFASDFNSDESIGITITGNFSLFKNLKPKDYNFTFEPNLINQSFPYDETEPKYRVMIDQEIPCKIVSINQNEIKVEISTKYVPDFYLLGNSHKITIWADKYFTESLIKISDPIEKDVKLFPEIDSIEVIKDDKNRYPVFLKLKGKNFMLFTKFSYSAIDNIFVFGYQTNIVSDENGDYWETLIHMPEPKKFSRGNHTVVYSTPFGTQVKSFVY